MALSWSLFFMNPAHPEGEPVLIRARELSEQLGEDAKQTEALLQLARFLMARREYGAARELAQRVLDLAEPAKAPAMVAEIYKWFTEGFEFADLKDAKVLLEELSD